MKLKIFTVSIVLIAALALGACQPKAESTSLDGTSWNLVELNGQSVLEDASVTLNFDGESLTGNDGCNHFGGSFTIDGNKLSIGDDLMSTLMACEGPIMQQAGEVTQALRETQSFKVENDQLILMDESNNKVAVFQLQSQELAGSSWLVSYVNTGSSEGVVSSSSIQAAQQTLLFDKDGKISGNAGCNDYFANYKVNGSGLLFSAIGSTKMFCGEGLMAEETAFLAALEKASSYHITANSLQIFAEDDTTLISLSRQE